MIVKFYKGKAAKNEIDEPTGIFEELAWCGDGGNSIVAERERRG